MTERTWRRVEIWGAVAIVLLGCEMQLEPERADGSDDDGSSDAIRNEGPKAMLARRATALRAPRRGNGAGGRSVGAGGRNVGAGGHPHGGHCPGASGEAGAGGAPDVEGPGPGGAGGAADAGAGGDGSWCFDTQSPGDPICEENACRHGAGCIDSKTGLSCGCPTTGVTPDCGKVRFRSLGFMADANRTNGYDLSDDGTTVVGETYLELQNQQQRVERGFRWTVAGGFERIVELSDADAADVYSRARQVNADGRVIAGNYRQGAEETPFVWRDGVASDFREVAGLDTQGVSGMSADGSVFVGGGTRGGTSNLVGFRWSESTGSELFLPYGADSDAFTLAISQDGSLVAGQSYGLDPEEGSVSHPLVWDALGTVTLLPTPTGFTRADVRDMNGDGSVIVGSTQNSVSGTPVVWIDGQATALPLDPYGPAYFFAVSADGSTVAGMRGSSGTSPDSRDARIWSLPSGEERRVYDVLTAAGVDLSGWSLKLATKVSADGKVVMGSGTYHCRTHTWIAWLD